MGEQHSKKNINIGLLAHVDAGKTTLSEAMLYCSGTIRTLGRVDHGNAFLDTFELERKRGITIFSKQAELTIGESHFTLLDTPGHADFAAEMERTLDVLDCAILVISAPAGVQSHTRTVWKLLRRRNIPTFIFINKTDLPFCGREEIISDLRRSLGDGFVDMSDPDYEHMAICEESLLEEFLEQGKLSDKSVKKAFKNGKIFLCHFGAALRLDGIEEFMELLETYAPSCSENDKFSAKVFKISRDHQGARLTHMKITGGILRVRETLSGVDWEEKVTQLRVYSGSKFRTVEEAHTGDVVAAVGLSRTFPGMGIGAESDVQTPSVEPVIIYTVKLPDGADAHTALSQFLQIEEEEPSLHVDWNERLKEIRVRLMGQIQLEILQQTLIDRFGLDVSFGSGSIIYRETISAPVEGVGHYEPLRHYAEVHLLLEPAERGSGIKFSSSCSEDELDRNWQRLIMTHLMEKQHIGVLTGSPITDIHITLMSGKAHAKHTEGGDFRQATYRAVRHGLMQAESILLEPWYDFIIELPQSNLGRALTDLQRMGAEISPPETFGDTAFISGSAPVSAMQDYPNEIVSYTHGLGIFSCSLSGYAPCPESDAVIQELGYDAEADTENPADSIFCSHGAGVNVKWYDVAKNMHLPSTLSTPKEEEPPLVAAARYFNTAAGDKELMSIFERTYGPINRNKVTAMRPTPKSTSEKPYKGKPASAGPEYVLIDGYNVIFAWDELKTLALDSLDLARSRLIDIMRNYQGFRRCPVIIVFDAYKVKGNPGSVDHLGELSIVYTKEAETADMYIEKATSDLGRKHRVRVVTSDGLEQIIILSHGALRVSALEFREEVKFVDDAIQDFLRNQH